MSAWLNTKKIIAPRAPKPCKKLKFCPYGQLVEAFPLKQQGKYKCPVFGHDCPVHYHAEKI
jgi:hypothetical protein